MTSSKPSKNLGLESIAAGCKDQQNSRRLGLIEMCEEFKSSSRRNGAMNEVGKAEMINMVTRSIRNGNPPA